MTRFVVVVGTDTEVGKTFIGCAVATAWSKRGEDLVALKPLESGTDLGLPQDGVRLATATGQTGPTAALFRFQAPLAPPAAAALEDRVIDWAQVLAETRRMATPYSTAWVEGAGGLLSPLAVKRTNLDLVLELKADVLLVGADRLGTLNHTLLTLEVLEKHGISPRAIALSAPATTDRSTGTNADQLRPWTHVPVVAVGRDETTGIAIEALVDYLA